MMRSIAGFRVIHETQKAKGKITVTIACFKEGNLLFKRYVYGYCNKIHSLKVRHLPVVENGEVIALLDIAKCLYDAIACTERAAEKGKAIVATVEGWGLFELIKGLIKDLDGDDNYEMGEDDFKEAQNSVARLIQMLYNDDPREVLKIIHMVKKHIMSGGAKRLPFTIPSLIYNALKTIEVLSMVPAPDLALRLYLECAEAANDCDLEPLGYVVNETLRILIFLRFNEEVTFFLQCCPAWDELKHTREANGSDKEAKVVYDNLILRSYIQSFGNVVRLIVDSEAIEPSEGIESSETMKILRRVDFVHSDGFPRRRRILRQRRHKKRQTFHIRNEVRIMTSEVRKISEHDRNHHVYVESKLACLLRIRT
ncbi:hypothetical protein LXL04_016131 [Taraxacum kok-saghyz]